MIKNKNFDIFCYINKNKQIALTKKKQVSFLKILTYLLLKSFIARKIKTGSF